jgi:hypothetical protein
MQKGAKHIINRFVSICIEMYERIILCFFNNDVVLLQGIENGDVRKLRQVKRATFFLLSVYSVKGGHGIKKVTNIN